MSVQDYEAVRIDNYLALIGLVPLYYDFILTFDDEVKYFWKLPLTKGSYCFFINRYPAAAGHLVLLILKVQNYGQKECHSALGTFHPIHLLVTQFIVCVLLGLRVWALFGCQRIVAIYLIAFLAGLVGIALWAVMGASGEYTLGCTSSWNLVESARVAVAWECLLVWDVNIFAMILWKNYKSLRINGQKIKTRLYSVLIRDGVIYFSVMFLANVINILTYYITPTRIKGSLSTFSSSMSVAMMSRLIINLNREAKRGYPSDSVKEKKTTHGMVFNSMHGASTAGGDTTVVSDDMTMTRGRTPSPYPPAMTRPLPPHQEEYLSEAGPSGSGTHFYSPDKGSDSDLKLQVRDSIELAAYSDAGSVNADKVADVDSVKDAEDSEVSNKVKESDKVEV